MSDFCMIMTTCARQESADAITQRLLEAKLAACIQSLNIQSSYVWEGSIVHEPEILLLIKAPSANFAEIESSIRSIHPYEIPEIIQLPIEQGNVEYLGWIKGVCTSVPGKLLE
jgi:periplasmic divalent cation tolerance protein